MKADKAKLSAQDVLLKTNETKRRVDQSNEELRNLIKQIRDFLTRTSPLLSLSLWVGVCSLSPVLSGSGVCLSSGLC